MVMMNDSFMMLLVLIGVLPYLLFLLMRRCATWSLYLLAACVRVIINPFVVLLGLEVISQRRRLL